MLSNRFEKLYWVLGIALVIGVFAPYLDSVFMGGADKTFHLNLLQDAILQIRSGQWPWVGQSAYAFNGISQSHNPMNPLWYGVLDHLTFRRANPLFLQSLQMCLCGVLSFIFVSYFLKTRVSELSRLWRMTLTSCYVFSPALLSLFFYNDATPAYSSTPWVFLAVMFASEFFLDQKIIYRKAVLSALFFMLSICSHPPIGLWTSVSLIVFFLLYLITKPSWALLRRGIALGLSCSIALLGFCVTSMTLGGSFSVTRTPVESTFFPSISVVNEVMKGAQKLAFELFVPFLSSEPVPNFNQTGLFALILIFFTICLILFQQSNKRFLLALIVPSVLSILAIYLPETGFSILRYIPSRIFEFFHFPYLRMNVPLLAFFLITAAFLLRGSPTLVIKLNKKPAKLFALLGLVWMFYQVTVMTLHNQEYKKTVKPITRQFLRAEHTEHFNWGNSGVLLPAGPSDAHWYLKFLGDSGVETSNLNFIRTLCDSPENSFNKLFNASECKDPLCTKEKIPQEWLARWDWDLKQKNDYYLRLESNTPSCLMFGVEEPYNWNHYLEFSGYTFEMPLQSTKRIIFFLEQKPTPHCAQAQVQKSCLVSYDKSKLPIKIISFIPLLISLEVNEPGILETHKMYLDNYKISVNNQNVEAIKGNNGTLQVPVVPGSNLIRIDYAGSLSAKISWMISFLFLSIGLAFTRQYVKINH